MLGLLERDTFRSGSFTQKFKGLFETGLQLRRFRVCDRLPMSGDSLGGLLAVIEIDAIGLYDFRHCESTGTLREYGSSRRFL
jgi:hypothetical protein